MAMKIASDPVHPSWSSAGTGIVGFDLRLVKPSYLALLANTVSFKIGWTVQRDYPPLSRNRYKQSESFHWHCTKRRYDQFGHARGRAAARKSDNESGFKEGGKKPPASDTDTAPSSRTMSASSAARTNQQPPDLDVDMLDGVP
jgi:hypothetical protein